VDDAAGVLEVRAQLGGEGVVGDAGSSSGVDDAALETGFVAGAAGAELAVGALGEAEEDGVLVVRPDGLEGGGVLDVGAVGLGDSGIGDQGRGFGVFNPAGPGVEGGGGAEVAGLGVVGDKVAKDGRQIPGDGLGIRGVVGGRRIGRIGRIRGEEAADGGSPRGRRSSRGRRRNR